ncbi:laccase [Armillaria nabsnona]|nr:laccase [Armillaria nabsnona]
MISRTRVHDANGTKTTSDVLDSTFRNGTKKDEQKTTAQCPIVKGDSFLYTFDSTDQAGTFWYHSHLSTQYCDGLRGPFIIYDPEDPHADLYDVDDGALTYLFASTADVTSNDYHSAPDATLINGVGRWSEDPSHGLALVNIVQGTQYRIRMLNVGCDTAFTFSIESHLMTIIEVDGVNHVTYTVDEIQIFSGQHYSFSNANQDVGNYWIDANPSVGTLGFEGGINSAILRYADADSLMPMNETDLVVPGGVVVALNLAFTFHTDNSGVFTVNGVQFIPPTTPVLLQILSGAQDANDLLPKGAVYPLPHTFDVIRSAGSAIYNYENPNVTIRFMTDNPGPWFLHCHTDWHLEAGLAVVLVEAVEDWNSTINPTGMSVSSSGRMSS